MDDIVFSNGFKFTTYKFEKYNYTDNRGGIRCHYFAYLISGRAKIVTDDTVVIINEGEFFYLPDKLKYQSYWYGKGEVKFISLGFPCLPNFDNAKYAAQVIKFDEKAEELFLRLGDIKQLTAADIGDFYTLVGLLLPKMEKTHTCRTRKTVEKAQRYMINNPFADIPEVAKYCAVSETSLYAAFKKSAGMTPNRMKNIIVLERAKDMLITTDESVEDISNGLNFSSTSYFRKKFEEHFGITPTQMRKKHRI